VAGGGGFSSSSDSEWKHDQYRGSGGGESWRSGGGDRDRMMDRGGGYSNSSGRDLVHFTSNLGMLVLFRGLS
jgi:hypothetical protein